MTIIDLVDDMKFAGGNDKRAAVNKNLWLPPEGEKLQIPYEIDPNHPYIKEIKASIESMNKVLHCHEKAWVERDAMKNQSHYVKFILDEG